MGQKQNSGCNCDFPISTTRRRMLGSAVISSLAATGCIKDLADGNSPTSSSPSPMSTQQKTPKPEEGDWIQPYYDNKNTSHNPIAKISSKSPEIGWTFKTDAFDGNGGPKKRMSRPISVNSNIYVGCGNGDLYSINRFEGKETWRYAGANRTWTIVGTEFEQQRRGPGGMMTTPAFSNGRVFAGNYDGNVYALDTNGREDWRYRTNGRIQFPPITSDGDLYIVSGDGFLYCINTSSGEKRWDFNLDEVRTIPAIKGSDVVISDSNGLHCVKSESGETLWKYQEVIPTADPPCISNDRVYVVGGHPQGELHSIDINSGEKIWSFDPTKESSLYSISVSEGGIHVLNENSLYNLNEGGGLKWKREFDNEFPQSVVTTETKVIIEGYSLNKDAKVVLAIDRGNRDRVWEIALNGFNDEGMGGLSISSNAVCFSMNDGTVSVLK